MQDSFLKRHLLLSTIVGALLILLGVYLMFQQESFVKIFISILGLFLAISGISALFSLKTYSQFPRTKVVTLIKALVSLGLGLVAFFAPILTAAVSWTLLLYFIAVELLFSAMIAFLDAFLLRKSEFPVTGLLSEAIVSLVTAVLLFVFPDQIGDLLLKLVGVLLIIIGLAIILWSQRIKQLNRQFKTEAVEVKAEVIDEN
ncbi:HdeD family acid-resistance protein [Sphaerochaeta sp.]|jgi:uncharacterized membrane protein HdeD (DUF308 family)|uniref:HdeD family acid-resistance protein n=1 Tax=Sphaerochaeta sp. TaxID=1972642 RepID=UPI002FCA22D2